VPQIDRDLVERNCKVAFSQAHLLPSTTDASEWRILLMTWALDW